MFLIMSLSVLLIFPSILQFIDGKNLTFIKEHLSDWQIDILRFLKNFSKITLPITSLAIIFIPESNTLLTKVAAEFTTIDNYIQYGEQSQIIQGNFDALVEYIVENEENPNIHLHTYSFGSIIALDALFPIGTEPCNNVLNNIKLLITVGAPYEFIDSYYPNFYSERTDNMSQQIEWINVYSTLDAFASNFRKDNKSGKAQFGITRTARTSGTTSNIYQVIYGNGIFVYSTSNGGLATSTDGITWSAQTSGITQNITELMYGAGKYVYGAGRNIATSNDAISWTVTTNFLSAGESFASMHYDSTCSVFLYGTSLGNIKKSTDTITWATVTSNTANQINDLNRNLYITANGDVGFANVYTYNVQTDFYYDVTPNSQLTNAITIKNTTAYIKAK